jgi:hypothetical protein
MTWTPERRQQASERMKATRPIAAKLAKKAETLPSGRITRNRIPLEDRRLIRQLGDERNALKQQLSVEQGLWEARKAELMRRIKSLSNNCIADKFEIRPNQVHQILNGTAGQSL